MKHLIPVILALLLCVSLLTGCNIGIKPSSQESAPATTAAAPATTAAAPVPTEPEPGPTEVPVDEPTGSVDMEAVLSKIVDENPGARVEELQDALLENPYFLMFSADDVNCYWGFNSTYEYHDICEASCIVDHGYTNYGAVVYVIEPEVGVDAEALAAELEQNLNLSWT